ncbi:phosphotransferase [Desulfococcaceae bacterium HSG9]|nr:phosphotransferase [Desulfococcaceae bacterium HSG9]
MTDAEFRNAASALAEFHNAVCDFDPGRLKREEPPITELLPIIARNFVDIAQKMRNSRFQSYFQENLKTILGIIERNPLTSQKIKGLPVIPAHYDFHPGNLKWDDEAVAGLFDFDWSKIDLRLFDVCMAVIYFCSRWGGRTDGELRLDKSALFLSSYHNRLRSKQGFDSLSDDEQQLLPTMLAIADIYLVHWEVADFHDTEEADDNEYLVYLKHNVRLMRWIETHHFAIAEAIDNALAA